MNFENFIFGLIIGICIFIILNYYLEFNQESYEMFSTSQKQSIGTVTATPTEQQDNSSTLPLSEYVYMNMETYDDKKISPAENKWFSTSVNMDEINAGDENINSFFITSQPPQLTTNSYNVPFMDLQNNELTGPLSLNFSNNTTNALIEFSTIFTIKMDSIPVNGTLLYILATTSAGNHSADDPSNNKQTTEPNIISSNTSPNSILFKIVKPVSTSPTHTIAINIGNQMFSIDDIQDDVILNGKDTTFGIVYKKSSHTIDVYINSKKHSFKTNLHDNIIMSPTSIIINKNGFISGKIYSVVFYKKAITEQDITNIIKYNTMKISGIIQKEEKYKEIEKQLILEKEIVDEKLKKCSNAKCNIKIQALPSIEAKLI
jgi:hypothetical protein